MYVHTNGMRTCYSEWNQFSSAYHQRARFQTVYTWCAYKDQFGNNCPHGWCGTCVRYDAVMKIWHCFLNIMRCTNSSLLVVLQFWCLLCMPQHYSSKSWKGYCKVLLTFMYIFQSRAEQHWRCYKCHKLFNTSWEELCADKDYCIVCNVICFNISYGIAYWILVHIGLGTC